MGGAENEDETTGIVSVGIKAMASFFKKPADGYFYRTGFFVDPYDHLHQFCFFGEILYIQKDRYSG